MFENLDTVNAGNVGHRPKKLKIYKNIKDIIKTNAIFFKIIF